jgi:hypothetical protein
MRIAMIALALVLVGCMGTPYRLPIPAEYDHAVYREVGFAEGVATGRVVLYYPIGINDVIERATKEAIAKNGGDALAYVIVQQKYSLFPFFGIRVFARGMVLRKIKPGEAESDYDRGRREERERLELEHGGR